MDSDSIGSLATFITSDWELADGEGFLTIEDDDYKDEGSSDEDKIDDWDDSDDSDDSDDRDDDRRKRACSPNTCDTLSGYLSSVDRLRDIIPRL